MKRERKLRTEGVRVVRGGTECKGERVELAVCVKGVGGIKVRGAETVWWRGQGTRSVQVGRCLSNERSLHNPSRPEFNCHAPQPLVIWHLCLPIRTV